METQILDKAQAVAIVDALAHAKSRQDVAAAMEIYHPEGVLESPSLGTRNEGGAIHKAIVGWFDFAPDYQVRLDGHAMDGGTLCCWGEISFTPAFTFDGTVPNGAQVVVPVFILFQFDDGRVKWESFHFDVAGAARQCGVDATALVRAA